MKAYLHRPIEILEPRVTPGAISGATVVFDFEGISESGVSSYELSDGDLKVLITRPGSTFDITASDNASFGTAISPFGDVSGKPFIINFSSPVKSVSLEFGDYGQDPNDNLVFEAYSKLNGKGKRLGMDRDTLPTLEGDPFQSRTLSVSASGIQSIKVIGGTRAFPNSVYLDRLTVSTSGIDLVADKIQWSKKKGGIELSYKLNETLPEGLEAKVALYWANGPFQDDILEQIPTSSFAKHSKKGTYREHISGLELQDAPYGTTHVLMVLDPDSEITEALETNNVRELNDVSLQVQSQVLGSISPYSDRVLKNLLRIAGEPEATVTSYLRTPEEQARIMFDNIIAHGVNSQFKLYAAAGDTVVQAFVDSVEENGWTTRALKLANRSAIQQAMIDAINILPDPGQVSQHLADPGVLQAIDLAPSSFAASTKSRFIQAAAQAQADGILRKFLQPPKDPAYHLEIKQIG